MPLLDRGGVPLVLERELFGQCRIGVFPPVRGQR